jgi:hypothetical protein
MRTSTKTIVAVGSVISLLMWATVALADDTVCQNGILGQETVVNLIVPDGSTCTLNGTIVQGNIHVGTGATLRAKAWRLTGISRLRGPDRSMLSS